MNNILTKYSHRKACPVHIARTLLPRSVEYRVNKLKDRMRTVVTNEAVIAVDVDCVNNKFNSAVIHVDWLGVQDSVRVSDDPYVYLSATYNTRGTPVSWTFTTITDET